MRQDREFRQLCKAVNEEFPQLTREQIMEMIQDAYECAQQHIAAGSLTPIYYRYLGRFTVKKGRKKWLQNRKDNDSRECELSSSED